MRVANMDAWRVLGPLTGIMLLVVIMCDAWAEEFRRLPIEEYRDKMAGGWIGQMVGVGWGGPTEFKWMSEIIPEDEVPAWKPELVNQFQQDDLYVEMTFLRTLELRGWDATIRQAGIDFANSGYRLWHANGQGRKNLRSGIAPPDSGHPEFNAHADCIDYQIEADYAGLIAPGLPEFGMELGEKFGRLMNYGDGLYGGQFMSGMYAEAFFESNPAKLVEAGLACIPEESQYAQCVRDVVAWHREHPGDWKATWQLLQAKYHDDPQGRRFVCGKSEKGNIDAKMNGAYVVMGLLYGNGDMDQTITISMRCGQDSDCNPSSAAGLLATAIGRTQLPDKFTSAIDPDGVFSHTAYTFPGLLAVCERLAREAVIRAGGQIETDDHGKETFVIPVIQPQPGPIEQSWEPTPPKNSRYSEEELKAITAGQ
jgi:ADP-ribosylglycohydrolase